MVSVGQGLPGVEIEIRDEDGKVLPPGERGEIYVRGEQVSGEYEGKGAVTDAEGWFPTRDAGSMDSEGYLFLEGRADDVIVRGGENLSPGEIEDLLLTFPNIADVAVVGVPDEQWGEAVAAAIACKEGTEVDADAVREFCQRASSLVASTSAHHLCARAALQRNRQIYYAAWFAKLLPKSWVDCPAGVAPTVDQSRI